MDINENIIQVFEGFLNLKNLEKLKLIEEINNYFDSSDREAVRAEHKVRFSHLAKDKICKCCGK